MVAPACLTDRTSPSTMVNCPIRAKISPGRSAFLTTDDSAQVPRRACRAAASAAASFAAHALSMTSADTSAQKIALDRTRGRLKVYEGGLPAIAIRIVALHAQDHAPADQRRERRPTIG